ncbi:MAG TPA: hypothetical protein VN947_25235 [Polyangia bacterium]|nr:hypothetical protein [Polyangia bacterium]
MNRLTWFAAAAGFAMVMSGCTAPDDPSVADDEAALNGAQDPPGARVFHAKGGGHQGGGGSPLLTWHGGPVLHTNSTEAIFWGTEWSSASFQGDKVTGLDTWFGGLDKSSFATTSTEYGDGSGNVTSSSSYMGHVFDNSAAPRKAIQVSDAVAEACKITNNNPVPNAVYFLYTSTGAGHVSYCAWHSAGTCSNGAHVQVAYMPNLDGIAGCDPQDDTGLHSQGLSALVNVTSHEWSEAISDPSLNAWYDAGGQENGDKCAWSFHNDVHVGGSAWKVQMEWSNAAYNAGTGYANLSGQNGCIQGN